MVVEGLLLHSSLELDILHYDQAASQHSTLVPEAEVEYVPDVP